MIKTGSSPELNNLEAQMNGEIAHLQRQKNINLIIGAALIVIIFGYFFFMSLKVRELMKPEVTAAMASQQVVSYLPEIRASMEQTARTEAPLLIDTLINKFLKETIPASHTKLKSLILSTADSSMEDAETYFFIQVNQQLENHRATLRTIIADLNTPKGARDFEDAILKTLEDVMRDPSVQADLMGYGVELAELDKTLFYLSQENVALTPVEESARELIAILREFMNRARQNS